MNYPSTISDAWEEVLASLCRLQMDHDHVLTDLEAVVGWQTARIQKRRPPVRTSTPGAKHARAARRRRFRSFRG
jgi:folylpolyglutamate synthase/dihydropteroate synthase